MVPFAGLGTDLSKKRGREEEKGPSHPDTKPFFPGPSNEKREGSGKHTGERSNKRVNRGKGGGETKRGRKKQGSYSDKRRRGSSCKAG